MNSVLGTWWDSGERLMRKCAGRNVLGPVDIHSVGVVVFKPSPAVHQPEFKMDRLF